MSDVAIKVDGLGKRFIISHEGAERYSALRDVITRGAKKLVSGNGKAATTREEFWALKDVSFEVNRGEAIGIIGRNGAGKSTLLKILSRITEPTNGRIEINGRIASLLEVGTGFHPELTGKENIFLNGAILGMSRAEIRKKFDEIVDFSGVEKFLDTPVKRYSSGMYVRLAFAVAAHLEPEILIVDEVLAVGDAEFQKKCLGKMDEVSRKEGRTVLFVSHNMDAILKFCSTSILLQNGQLIKKGNSKDVIDNYLHHYVTRKEKQVWNEKDAPSDNFVKLLSVWLHDDAGTIRSEFQVSERIGISMEYEVLEEGTVFTHGLNIYNSHGINVFNSHDVTSDFRKIKRAKGKYQATAWIPSNLLSEESFSIGVGLFSPNPFYVHVHELDVVAFVTHDNMAALSARGDYIGEEFGGVVRPLLSWDTRRS